MYYCLFRIVVNDEEQSLTSSQPEGVIGDDAKAIIVVAADDFMTPVAENRFDVDGSKPLSKTQEYRWQFYPSMAAIVLLNLNENIETQKPFRAKVNALESSVLNGSDVPYFIEYNKHTSIVRTWISQ